MLYYLNGTVAELDANLAVIDCGGVGFEVNTTATTIAQLRKGETARIYTYLNVREDAMELYGFATQSEKRFFQLLIGVSGVGPKAALAILSANTPEGLTLAIVTGDEKTLMAAPGIGKKIAQRVILELKDKVARETESVGWQGSAPAAPLTGGHSPLDDAAAALGVLGYSAGEIHAALRGIDPEGKDTEALVKLGLRALLRG